MPESTCTSLDIASIIGPAKRLTDEVKYSLLTKCFVPDNNFKFPFTKFGRQQRAFNVSWLTRYPGLVYSPSMDGAYCIYCAIFRPENDRKGQLVLEPFRNWKKAMEKLDEHFHNIRHNSGDTSASSHKRTGTGYQLHMDCVSRKENFVQVMTNKQAPINVQMDFATKERVEKNTKIMETIVETVLLCGRQNIALRGHRDDAKYSNDPDTNTGNFQALLQYRINAGDSELQHHIQNGPKNATYVSKTTQNEIISIIGEKIQRQIVQECVTAGGFFSLSADEVRDVGNQEQLAVTIRFLDTKNNIKESFLGFIDVSESTTGENLAKALLDFVDRVGLDASKMRSQCYDGAGNMAGKTKGVGARIQRQHPKALPFWCVAHQLNRCIVQACSIPSVRNMMNTADQIVRFFEFSPAKQNTLEDAIDRYGEVEFQKKKLKELCRTRWVERHDALDVFIDLVPAVVETLESYASRPNTRTPGAADASSLLHAVCNFDFVVCIIIVRACLSFLQGLSRSLQERKLDVCCALKNVSAVKTSLEKCREEIDSYNQQWFQKAVAIAESLDIAVTKPRTCRRQTGRSNVPADNVEDYFRKSISIPLLDFLLQEMSTRFSDLHQRATLGLKLVPSELNNQTNIDELMPFFGDDLPLSSSLQAEVEQWNAKWTDRDDKPASLTTAITECDPVFYKNIFTILKICATFPVTSCECERSISVLRLLKTYLRSTMGQQRLSSLALMFVHRNITISTKEIVAEFARKQPRKMKLPNIMFEDLA